MFGTIESYFPSDNIHLFVPFRTPSVAYISINLFQIKQQKLALPSSPFANQSFSARMNICEGWSPVGWGPSRPTWSPSPPGSKFSSSSPLFSNPDLPPACSKTSGKKSRTTKKNVTHLLGLFASSFVSDSERLHVSREVSKLAPLLTGLLVVGKNINSEKNKFGHFVNWHK